MRTVESRASQGGFSKINSLGVGQFPGAADVLSQEAEG